MGFYLRKSVRVGLLKFNFSKSGIEVSAGVKGMRVGFGPRGNYVHASAGGFHYRSTLTPKQARPQSTQPSVREDNSSLDSNMKSIDSDMNLLFQESSEDQLVKEISHKMKKWNSWKWITALAIASFLSGYPGVATVGFVLTIVAYFVDETRKSVVLFYDFDESQENSYTALIENFERFLNTKRIWHVTAKGQIKDWKRNSGAIYEVSKKTTPASLKSPSFIKTNIPIPTIKVGQQTICFLPDKLLMLSSDGAATVPYHDLSIEISDTRFIEGESVPSDASVIDETWQYVNRKGGPDKRFKQNKRLPICRYENVHLSSPTGLREQLQLSKCGQFEPVRTAISNMCRRSA